MLQVDPNCNPKLFGKIEDDVPTFYKRLRYPFQISKSSLFAVGSPHTWPSLLASLVWITELLSYAEKAVNFSCCYVLMLFIASHNYTSFKILPCKVGIEGKGRSAMTGIILSPPLEIGSKDTSTKHKPQKI